MPIKNIVTEQPVTKAKLERAKELRREMTPAEKPAKRVAGNPRQEDGSPFSEAASYLGIHRRFLLSPRNDHTGSSTRRGWLCVQDLTGFIVTWVNRTSEFGDILGQLWFYGNLSGLL